MSSATSSLGDAWEASLGNAALLLGACHRPGDGAQAIDLGGTAVDEEPPSVQLPDLLSQFRLVATPGHFAATALARQLSLRHREALRLLQAPPPFPDVMGLLSSASPAAPGPSRRLQLVHVGLGTMATVLAELADRDPPVCAAALASLRAILESLSPNELAAEAPTTIHKLFASLALLRGAQSEEVGLTAWTHPEADAVDNAALVEVSSRASSCLLSLAVGFGTPELLLRAAYLFLTTPGEEEAAEVAVPRNYRLLHLQALLGLCRERASLFRLPSWFTSPIPESREVISFAVPTALSPSESAAPGSLVSDGPFLYALTRTGLYKLGTGLAHSLPGKEYACNPLLKAAADHSWLGMSNGSLYLRRKSSSRLWVLDRDTLREIGEILLPASAVRGALTSDGTAFSLLTTDAKGSLISQPLTDGFSPSASPDFCVRLTASRLVSMGPGPPEANVPPSLLEGMADFAPGRKASLLLTKTGRVFVIDAKKDEPGEKPVEVSLAEPIAQLCRSVDGGNVLLRSASGGVWYAGGGLDCDGASPVAALLKDRTSLAHPRRLSIPGQRRFVHVAVSASCVGLVSESGRAFVFGRHVTHSHPDNGQILGLNSVHIVAIGFGKTHAVALTKTGSVYTWGLNNLHQCGRAESSSSAASASSSPAATPPTSLRESPGGLRLCAPNDHLWVKDVATICTACRLCSAHAAACPSKAAASPKGGTLSACGGGEAGCLRCGICRRCGELGSEDRKGGSASSDGGGSSERSRRLLLQPSKLSLKGEPRIVAITTGNYHTLLLSQEGQVFSFGSNCQGQLGVGDTRRRLGPQAVLLPRDAGRVVQVAAGANHSVLRGEGGEVWTFGSNRQDQLGREGKGKSWQASPGRLSEAALTPSASFEASPARSPESATPGRAWWVGAVGEGTIVGVEERLLGSQSLDSLPILSSPRLLVILQPNHRGQARYVVLRRGKLKFRCFPLAPSSAGIEALAWCLDPVYDIIWTHNALTGSISGLSYWDLVGGGEAESLPWRPKADAPAPSVGSPQLQLPVLASVAVHPAQAALSILHNVYSLSWLWLKGCQADEAHPDLAQSLSASGYVVRGGGVGEFEGVRSVARFQNYGGGWGYSAQSIEAIQFQPSHDIQVVGLGLYGGRGEYVARLKLLRLVGEDHDEHNLELIAESEELLFECAPREKARIMFPKPAFCQAAHTYIAWAQINGPSSDCGAGGQRVVRGSDGVSFHFQNSRLSNNGTDVHVGQIPLILYRVADAGEVRDAASVSSTSATPEEGEEELTYAEVASLFSTHQTPDAPPPLLAVTPHTFQPLFNVLEWILREAGGASSRHSGTREEDWRDPCLAQFGSLVFRLLRLYLPILSQSTTLPSGDKVSVAQRCLKLLDQFFAFHIDSALDAEEAAAVTSEALSFHVECFTELFPSHESVQSRLSTLMRKRNGGDEWQLVALLESLAASDRLLPTLLFSDAWTGAEAAPPSKNFPALLRFLAECAFGRPTEAPRLQTAAGRLLIRIQADLVSLSEPAPAPVVLATPRRFRRVAAQALWDSSGGTPDAVGFRVDRAELSVHGFGVFLGSGATVTFAADLLLNQGEGSFNEAWQVLEKSSGSLSVADAGHSEEAFIRFHKPVKLLPGSLYAARISLQGGKTWGGEAGLASVRTAAGATVAFHPCSLSLNGSNVARGQIPSLLYSVGEPKELQRSLRQLAANRDQTIKWLLLLTRSVCGRLVDAISAGHLGSADPALLSQFFGWLGLFLSVHPRRSLDVLAAADDLLPVVVADNNRLKERRSLAPPPPHSQTLVVESEHPYRPASVSSHIARFEADVGWLCLELDPRSATGGPDDALSVLWSRDGIRFRPLARYSGADGWPAQPLLVPGHCLWFILESGAAPPNASPDQLFGFRASLSAAPSPGPQPPSLALEAELGWLVAAACRCLVGEAQEPAGLAEEELAELLPVHGGLLRKGLSLAHPPTIRELMQGGFPAPAMGPEAKFLRELMSASESTGAGRLGRWLCSEPFLDLAAAELSLEPPEGGLRVGKAAGVRLRLADQYGRPAAAAQLKVDVTVRFGQGSADGSPTGGGLPSLASLQATPYQPTYLNKARYTAINLMPAFQDLSWEELRLAYFRDAVLKESVAMAAVGGDFSGTWVPRQPGTFLLEARIDGFRIPDSYRIQVGAGLQAPKGRRVAQLSRARLASVPSSAATRGVRIRSAPRLSAAQIGVIPRAASVAYIEEVENREGVWLRLTDEAALLYCSAPQFPTQSWALQYHAVLRRHLLAKDEDEPAQHDFSASLLVASDETYVCADTAVSVFGAPSEDEAALGTIPPGEHLKSSGWLQNREGIWIRLRQAQLRRLLNSDDVEEGYCRAYAPDGSQLLTRLSLPGSPSRLPSTGAALSAAASNGNEAEDTEADMSELTLSDEPPTPLPKPTAHVWPQPKTPPGAVAAVSPSVADATRAVFAAWLWHEGLVQDAMAAAAYLRFHPELGALQARHLDSANYNVPASLRLLARLWQDTAAAVTAAVRRQAEPQPPSPPQGVGRGRDVPCELCSELIAPPLASHMRLAHPGCGAPAGGHGYNSVGKYTSGWSGSCGDGGRGVATWFLLCNTCRYRHYSSRREPERNARQRRLSGGEPQAIVRANAEFLLGLNASLDEGGGATTAEGGATGSGWAINLFPESGESATESVGSRMSGLSLSPRLASHTSDPGPKRRRSILHHSVPCSEPFSEAPGAPPSRSDSKDSRLLLASPSAALRSLSTSARDSPVLAFVGQRRELGRLGETMRLAVRRAAVLAHAFRVWNWLLRLVTTEAGVMDVLWNFLAAMGAFGGAGEGGRSLYKHPWHMCLLAGGWSRRMLRQFHVILQTTTVILRSDAVDPAMKRLCFRAWMFQMSPHEQELILQCQLLSCVGRVMAEGDAATSQGQAAGSSNLSLAGLVEQLSNLSGLLAAEPSSRVAMGAALTDGTTDTFWESGEEDKGRAKTITVSLESDAAQALLISVYIDNVRDSGQRVSSLTVYAGGEGGGGRRRLSSRMLDAAWVGWVPTSVQGSTRVVVELKGPDAAVRVRGLSALGVWRDGEAATMKSSPSHLLAFSAAQADAFSVFQTIAAQAFTAHFNDTDEGHGSLRQQVFDILFSKTQLASLQGYVCSQVASALSREVDSLGRSAARRNYSYCCGLMAMLARISATPAARDCFAARGNLLSVLGELLLFASAIVQAQALDTMEKLLPLFSPGAADAQTLVLNLLAVLAKVITVQVREKASRSVRTETVSSSLDEAPSCWRLERPCSTEIGRLVCAHIVHVAEGVAGEDWASAFRGQVAARILALAELPESQWAQDACVRSRNFWLALAALSVLREQSWLSSSAAWAAAAGGAAEEAAELCENHEDETTPAQILCRDCDLRLCRPCFTVLHLSRRNRAHATQVVGRSERRPCVNVHEGCSRLRLPWLLVLLDGTTLNGMVEFSGLELDVGNRNLAPLLAPACRFCRSPAVDELGDVCAHPDCQAFRDDACAQRLACAHLCGGVAGELECLPCLTCAAADLRQDGDDLCVICFTDRLGAAPALLLGCGHLFHAHCLRTTLNRRWPGPRISFTFMKCPICQAEMKHPALELLLQPLRDLYEQVAAKAKLRLEYDSLAKCPAIANPGGPFHGDPLAYALEHYVYVLCHVCGKAYFGGEAHCQEALVSSSYKAEELVCGGCSDVAGAQVCPRHGSEFLEYKCRFCCSVAVFFCFGTTHFCASCHDDFTRLVPLPAWKLAACPAGPRSEPLEASSCPLKVEHPPTGEEFALGCGVCRNLSSF